MENKLENNSAEGEKERKSDTQRGEKITKVKSKTVKNVGLDMMETGISFSLSGSLFFNLVKIPPDRCSRSSGDAAEGPSGDGGTSEGLAHIYQGPPYASRYHILKQKTTVHQS